MATEELQLIIGERGAREAAARIRDLGKSASTAGNAVRRLRAVLLTIGVGVGFRELKETADAYVQISNRIKLATDSTEEYNRVSKELFDIAQRTRAPLQATTELFRRLAVNTRGLSFSTDRLLGLIETINKSIIISGATAKEASSGLIQLSQGFASGQIRGEEFRSVAEQLPGLLIAVADGLGVTIGRLRELAFQGELTPELFAKAVEANAKLIDETFELITPTIEQAGITLNNAFIDYIGRVNEATKGSKAFRDIIKEISDNMDRLASALVSAVAAYGAYRAAAYAATVATRILKASIRSLLISTGVGALVVALGLAIDALITFGLKTEEIEGVSVSGFNKIGAAITAAWRTLKILVQQFAAAFPGIVAAVKKIGKFLLDYVKEVFEEQLNDIKTFLKNTKNEFNKLVGILISLPEAFRLAWDNIPAAMGVVGINLFNALAKPIEEGLNQLIRQINERFGSFLPFIPDVEFGVDLTPGGGGGAGLGVEKLNEEIGKVFKKNMDVDYVGDFFGQVARGGAEIGKIFTAEYNDALGETIALLQAQAEAEKKKQEDIEREKAALKEIEEAEAFRNKKKKEAVAAERALAGLADRLRVLRERANDPLDAELEKYKQAEEKARKLGEIAGVAVENNEALQLALEGQTRVTQEKADLTQKEAELAAELAEKINEIAKTSPEYAQEMREARDAIYEQGGGIEKITDGLEGLIKKSDTELKKIQKKAEKAAEEVAEKISKEIAGVFENLIKGEVVDFSEILAKRASEALQKSMEGVFKSLTEAFQKLLKKVSEGLKERGGILGKLDLGAGLGALVGVGGLLLSAALKKGSQQVENELAAESIVTDVRDVRGVVAGPTNIPIFQIGAELENALNPTNEILIDIRDALQGRAAPASVLSVEEEAGMLLNSTSPTLI